MRRSPADERARMHRHLLRTDFQFFLERVFATLNPAEPLIRNWHLSATAHCLSEVQAGNIRRLIVNQPPRSLKSITASVAWPAFLLGRNPSAKIVCVSYGTALATDLSRQTRRIMESRWYREANPGTRLAKNTEDLLETTKGGTRHATSVGGAAITGFGGDYIIIDDPMKADDAHSQAARDTATAYFRETLFSRLNNKATGIIVLVMQRLHDDDLSGYLLRQGGWHHLCLPSIATCDEDVPIGGGLVHHRRAGDLLQPNREPQSAVDESRRNLGGPAFEAQYQQSPIPLIGNMVKAEWLLRYDQLPPLNEGRIIQSWDTASKGDPQHDYSVCTTWLEHRRMYYLIDVFRKQLDYPALNKAVVALYQRYYPAAVLIEDHGSGQSLIQDLKASTGIPVLGRKALTDKPTRLSIVLPMMEAGQVYFPNEAPWVAELLRELMAFPAYRYDDQVDSISQFLGWVREDQRRTRFEFDFDNGPALNTHHELAAMMISAKRG